MKNIERKIIAIVGPTASGKTAVGVKLAKEFNGEIVSADSRQIFRGLDIGTGKDLSEYDGAKYHLIDIVEPCTTKGCRAADFNLFKYLELARTAIEDIFSRGKVPIIVGGTGLYVQALIEGFELKTGVIPDLPAMNEVEWIGDPEIVDSRTPSGIPDLRGNDEKGSGNDKVKNGNDERSREQLEQLSVEQLQNILQEIDVQAYGKLIDKKNPHRLIRAIERAQGGEEMIKVKPDFEVLQIGIEWSREILNQRIDKRVDDRFEEGMLGEVVGLIGAGVDADWLLKLGLEYRIITEFLISNKQAINNVISDLVGDPLIVDSRAPLSGRTAGPENDNEFELMKNQLKLKSHQYAKRQMTWFKRFPEIVWENDYSKIKLIARHFLK